MRQKLERQGLHWVKILISTAFLPEDILQFAWWVMVGTQAKVCSLAFLLGESEDGIHGYKRDWKMKGYILERREQRRRSPKICFNPWHAWRKTPWSWKRYWLKAERIELKFSFYPLQEGQSLEYEYSLSWLPNKTKFFGGKLAESRISIMSSI